MTQKNPKLTAQELEEIAAFQGLSLAELEELDAILEDLRSRDDEIPQWDFVDGFMAALICSRRSVEPQDYFLLLLGVPDIEAVVDPADDDKVFAEESQKQRFLQLWQQRWDKAVVALDAKLSSFNDPACYMPQVQDIRGMLALLPEAAQAEFRGKLLPSYAQDWAYGFMFVVETWSEDWTLPRDKLAAQMFEQSLEAIQDLTEDDIEPARAQDDAHAGASKARLEALEDAILALYQLRAVGQVLRANTGPVLRAPTPGRNDPCYCGSGKKYKKCHGA
ncbi:MAG: UPF0149 family protein [Rhodoferax sp.]|nr:UPF0149 family protein [Rhodoferax sp.]